MKQDFQRLEFFFFTYVLNMWYFEAFILGAFQSWDFKLQVLSLHIPVAYLHFCNGILKEPFHALYPQCLAHTWCTLCISD